MPSSGDGTPGAGIRSGSANGGIPYPTRQLSGDPSGGSGNGQFAFVIAGYGATVP
jgi:hypothetical protein